jgi:MscS family membrane protein
MPRLVVSIVIAALLAWLGSAGPARADDPHTPYLLSMPDLSSPRATLRTLLTNAEVARRDFHALGPAWEPRPAVLRMMDTLDTSAVPAGQRLLAAAFATTQLAAVLAHLPPDRLAGAPDAEAVRGNDVRAWRVPGTPIVIARASAGPRAGQFLFTSETVAIVGDLYAAVKAQAARDRAAFAAVDEWNYAPGPLIPRGLIAALPSALLVPVMGQALWQWIGLVLLLTVAGFVAWRVVCWGLRHDATRTRLLRRVGQPLAAAGLVAICAGTLLLTFYGLKIWGPALSALVLGLRLVIMVGLTWFAMALIRRVAHVIVETRGFQENSLNSQLIRVVSTLLIVALVITSGFLIADFIGIPLGPLLAGLGIGGFAIALAVRSTLENVIGGLTLFADRPARVGEFCRIGAESGTVEEIGLRTTKLRRLDDTLVTIPNAEMAQVRIENVTRRRRTPFNPRLGLRYETTAGQLKTISEGILAMLADHPKVINEGARVRLVGFGDYALNLDVFAYIDESRLADFVKVQEELNFRIMDIVQQAGAAFAFPSQTNYIARDTPPPAWASAPASARPPAG